MEWAGILEDIQNCALVDTSLQFTLAILGTTTRMSFLRSRQSFHNHNCSLLKSNLAESNGRVLMSFTRSHESDLGL